MILTGKIIDVTSKPPETISNVAVKAPTHRVAGEETVVTSSPAEVQFDKRTGSITIRRLEPGFAWLHIEGRGWSDSIPMVAAEGMKSLIEAVVNATGVPGMADYLSLSRSVDDRALAAVKKLVPEFRWNRPALPKDTDLNEVLEPGFYPAETREVAESLHNTPSKDGVLFPGVLEVLPAAGDEIFQRWTSRARGEETPFFVVWRWKTGGEWSDWVQVWPDPELSRRKLERLSAWERNIAVRRAIGSRAPGPKPLHAWVGSWGQELVLPVQPSVGQSSPSVHFEPHQRDGYHYRMVVIPETYYKDQNTEPHLLASVNGEDWVVPPGTRNPVVSSESGFKAVDVSLDDTRIFWRAVNSRGNNKVYTDEIPSRGRRDVLTTSDKISSPHQVLVSNGNPRIYYINAGNLCYRAPLRDGGMGAEQVCVISPGNSPGKTWRSAEVRKVGDTWWAVVQDGILSGDRLGDIYLCRSDDGIYWENSTLPLVCRSTEKHDYIFGASLVFTSADNDSQFEVYYAGHSVVTGTTKIFRSLVECVSVPSAPGALSGAMYVLNPTAQGGFMLVARKKAVGGAKIAASGGKYLPLPTGAVDITVAYNGATADVYFCHDGRYASRKKILSLGEAALTFSGSTRLTVTNPAATIFISSAARARGVHATVSISATPIS
ncbi:hypothetical protein CPHO_07030 [Corynebacterium phocae]|uniref:Uncharacterized protein n=1 Tax=Corynebacterium phocae TaxID=161895 RepID=A0A1L7D3N9_9CORY|nr:pyocin knob domain-containing protein [Corynebacterium phocae]APT92687.1 hypothetical protein CPHO_07030 [Corynebacterium phocae]KAA8723576.1 hypothetical protein F4V58_06540 [Corynebacterium phocae]